MSDRESLEISRAFHAGWEAHKMHMLTNGQRVEWCETHADKVMPHLSADRCRWSVKVLADAAKKPCRIVSKLLSVYPKEAEK